MTLESSGVKKNKLSRVVDYAYDTQLHDQRKVSLFAID